LTHRPAPEPSPRARPTLRPPTVAFEETLPPRPVDLEQETAETQAVSADSTGPVGAQIAESFHLFLRRFDEFSSGVECAAALDKLRDFILEKKGFTVVLNDMKNWSNQVGHGTWDSKAKDTLKKRVDIWLEKLTK
jgi:hypothetical protein